MEKKYPIRSEQNGRDLYIDELKTEFNGKEYTGELWIVGSRTLDLTVRYRMWSKASHRVISGNDPSRVEYEAEQLFQELLTEHESQL